MYNNNNNNNNNKNDNNNSNNNDKMLFHKKRNTQIQEYTIQHLEIVGLVTKSLSRQ